MGHLETPGQDLPPGKVSAQPMSVQDRGPLWEVKGG